MRADEDNRAYIRRIARIAQKKHYLSYDEPVKRVNFDELRDDALPQFTAMLIDGIKRSVHRPDTVPEGTERRVIERDDNTGATITSWVRPDNESFVRDPQYGHRDCRRVTRIAAPMMQTLYQSADADTRRAASGGW
jgi:hypothetical protein